jgi:ketosteroid isomerase-like protein
MSQENVQLVQRWLESFTGDVDAFRDTLHPEIEWFPFEENHSPSYGIGGAMRIRDQWLGAWEEMRADLEEIVDEGDEVIASIHITARGRSSGVEVDTHLHMHFKMRDEKVVYLFEHTDRTKALEAARQTKSSDPLRARGT